jgi:exodeoxyribonuclease VII large subunit
MSVTASPASADRSEQVLSVSQLTAQFKTVVEQQFPSVWVAGEISNFSRPQSGHCYFTLKDDKAQLRGVIWRGTASRLKFDLHDGLEVVCRGRLDVYPPRGSYQLVVDQLQPKGIGALELALRKLRAKLEAEGLFAPTRKRALPSFPRRIGIVTSPTGAAIHDFLQVLDRRWQGVEVLILPVRVQGTEATGEIATAIEQAGRIVPPLDVLVVGRGGGSLEDLWAFNEELVVRAIASSTIPVISAVGHEIDVTLADLAADVRALTPSEAAERVVPSAEDVTQLVKNLQLRLLGSLTTRTANLRSRLDALASRPALSRPLERVHLLGRRTDELAVRLNTAMRTRLGNSQAEIETFAGKLEALSPLAVLQRGYSLTQDQASGVVIRTTQLLQTGQRLRTRLAQGEVVSVVESSSASPNIS